MATLERTALPEGVLASTSQLRRIAAHSVHLRLPWQLDYRLDTVLDPDGVHILGMVETLSVEHPARQRASDDIVRCAAILQFIGHDIGSAFHAALDVRAQDYLACKPMNLASMQEDAARVWRAFMEQLREHPEVFGGR